MAMHAGRLSCVHFAFRKELFTLMAEISLIFQCDAREQESNIMKVIYGAAGMFVLLALWAAWQALMLIPTDLGNSYLVAASVLFSTAGLLTGFGVVGQRIIREIQALEPAMAMPAVEPAPRKDPPTIAPTVAPIVPEPMLSTPEPVAPVRPMAPVLAGTVAGAAAGAVLGGALRPSAESQPESRLMDDFERDLFADLRAPAPQPTLAVVEPVIEPRREDLRAEHATLPEPAAPEAVHADVPPVENVILGEPEDSALPAPAREVAADTGDDDDLVLPPLPPLPSFGLPDAAPSDAEIRAIEDAAHHDDDVDDTLAAPAMAEPESRPAIEPMPEPEPQPAPEPLPPEPASHTPGLIHDEDLAALSEAEADLAPLETLDVVGAYDSGGTRFTMYSDGSVTAKGVGVDRRFRSLDDLRAFIDGGMRG